MGISLAQRFALYISIFPYFAVLFETRTTTLRTTKLNGIIIV